MGGVMFIAGTVVGGILLGRGQPDGIAVLLIILGFGFIGFLDDYIKVVLKRSLGLRAREKLLGQILLAAGLAFWVVKGLERGTDVVLPFSGYFALGGASKSGWPRFKLLPYSVWCGYAGNLTDGLTVGHGKQEGPGADEMARVD